jgi:pyruvate kinase
MSRTRIVATIGPATNSRESLQDLVQAGMGVARLNGSHADLDWHRETIALLRETVPSIPILLDIPGRKIRTTLLPHEPSFELGETIILTSDAAYAAADKVPVNYASLHEDIKPGDIVFADDGMLKFTVTKVEEQDIHMRAETPGKLRSRKGINVPFVKLRTALITERDHAMMSFARETGVDFVGISFVESRDHVDKIRELIGVETPLIVSKIENQGGLDRMDEIIDATDVVMIDRGDLSVETNLESLAIFQKRIIKKSRMIGKPVIVATEMLHTMIDNSFPTKAEISDITNAIIDGGAALMLSGETAIGKHPVAAVSIMRSVADVVEDHMQAAQESESTSANLKIPQAIEDAIALICGELPITKVVAITKTGFAARKLSARQIRQPIIAISNNPVAARGFNFFPGVEGVHIDMYFPADNTDHIIQCIKELLQLGKLSAEDMILITAVGFPKSGNRMNLIQTHVVKDLIDSLGWQ